MRYKQRLFQCLGDTDCHDGCIYYYSLIHNMELLDYYHEVTTIDNNIIIDDDDDDDIIEERTNNNNIIQFSKEQQLFQELFIYASIEICERTSMIKMLEEEEEENNICDNNKLLQGSSSPFRELTKEQSNQILEQFMIQVVHYLAPKNWTTKETLIMMKDSMVIAKSNRSVRFLKEVGGIDHSELCFEEIGYSMDKFNKINNTDDDIVPQMTHYYNSRVCNNEQHKGPNSTSTLFVAELNDCMFRQYNNGMLTSIECLSTMSTLLNITYELDGMNRQLQNHMERYQGIIDVWRVVIVSSCIVVMIVFILYQMGTGRILVKQVRKQVYQDLREKERYLNMKHPWQLRRSLLGLDQRPAFDSSSSVTRLHQHLSLLDQEVRNWDIEGMTQAKIYQQILTIRLWMVVVVCFAPAIPWMLKSYYLVPITLETIGAALVTLIGTYALVPSQAQKHDTSNFPKAGIRYSYVSNDFVEECGGKEALQDMTTAQVCERFVKPKTGHDRSSYCDLLRKKGHPAYEEKARIFISHAHSYKFLDVLSALDWYFRDEPYAVIWFDLFSINQHITTDWSFDWLSTTFKSAIGQFGKVIMVMSPWNDPYPFTRAWCVFEAYCAVATGSELEVAMSKVDEGKFLDDLRTHPNESVDEMLTTIRAEKSQCSIENDRKRIFAVITKSVGFSKLDELIFNRYWEWMIEVSERACENCADNNDDQSLFHLRAVGTLFQKQGKYKEAGYYLKDHLNRSRERYGESSFEFFVSMHAYGELLRQQGKLKLAKSMLEDCLQSCANLVGLEHPLSIECMRSAAETYSDIGQYRSAEKLFQACLGTQEKLSNDSQLGTLRAMGSLAVLYSRIGSIDRAEKVAEECARKCEATWGVQHPLTIEANIHLADTCLLYPLDINLQKMWQKWSKGRHIHKKCLRVGVVIFGNAHPLVKHSKLSLRFGSSFVHWKKLVSGHAAYRQFVHFLLTLPVLVLAQIHYVTNDFIEAIDTQKRRYIQYTIMIIFLPILFEQFLHMCYCEFLPVICPRNTSTCNRIWSWYYWIEDLASLLLYVPRSIRFLLHLPIVIVNRGIAAIPTYMGGNLDYGNFNYKFVTSTKTYPPYCEEYNISLLKQRYRHQGGKVNRWKAMKMSIAAIDDE